MEAARKRVCRGGGGGSAPDRLSALSDDLLRRVLSLLPSRSAVQTCVLSKRWVDLWRSVPAVQLDIDDFGGLGEDNRWGRMKDFATEFLMLQNTERLDVFRLVADYYYCSPPADFLRWARCGINQQPFVLQISAHEIYWKDLRISRLSSAFRRLKRLELSGVYLDHSFAEILNSGCPVLEDLVLDYCRNELDVIQSDTLKNLSVDHCENEAVDVLIVRAPCLASLCFGFPHCKNGLSLEAGNSLVRASIFVNDYDDDQTSQRGQTSLVGSLFNVTSLELDGISAMAILDKELDKLPTFDNLKTLSLNRCFSKRDVDKFKAIGRLLQKSPNLEELTLHNFWYFEGTIKKWGPWYFALRLEKVKPVVGPIEFPMHGNLRTLFLNKCDFRDNFRILRHFLWSCPNLEKLTIRLCEFKQLPEASPGWNGGVKLKTTRKAAKSKKTHSGFRNLVRIQCHKLKSTEIIYEKGAKIQELMRLSGGTLPSALAFCSIVRPAAYTVVARPHGNAMEQRMEEREGIKGLV